MCGRLRALGKPGWLAINNILLYEFSIIKYQNNNIIIMHPILIVIIIRLLFVATVLLAIAGVAVLPPHDTGT